MTNNLTAAVAAVDVNASADPADTPPLAAVTFGDMLNDVASAIASAAARAGVSHRTIADSAIVTILATHGASAFTIEQWSADIGDRVRSNRGVGGWSTTSADAIARLARANTDARDGA